MASLQGSKVTNTLHLLAEVSATRTEEILDHQQPSQNANGARDEQNDSNSPIFDSFYNQSRFDPILKMTTFSPDRIFKLYNDVSKRYFKPL